MHPHSQLPGLSWEPGSNSWEMIENRSINYFSLIPKHMSTSNLLVWFLAWGKFNLSFSLMLSACLCLEKEMLAEVLLGSSLGSCSLLPLSCTLMASSWTNCIHASPPACPPANCCWRWSQVQWDVWGIRDRSHCFLTVTLLLSCLSLSEFLSSALLLQWSSVKWG